MENIMAIDERTRRDRIERIVRNAKRYGANMSEEEKKQYRDIVHPPGIERIDPEKTQNTKGK